MTNIQELREKRETVYNRANAFLDSKRGGNGLLTDEEAATYDRMEAEIIALSDQIDRLERHRSMADRFSAPVSKPLLNAPGAYSGRGSGGYADAFWNALRGKGVSNVLSEGVDTSGGFLVPEEFSSTLVEALNEQNIFRQISRIVSTSHEKLKVPIATAAGSASWVDENDPVPESEPAFGQITLNAYKIGTLMRASTELVEDSAFNIQSYIAAEFARRIGAKEEEAFCVNYGTDTSPEGRMVIRNVLKATMEGLGKGETPIFPIQVFRLKKGVNMDECDPNYDLFRLALACSAKRMLPNFAFQDAPFNLKYYREGEPQTEIAYMGCRTRVIGNATILNRRSHTAAAISASRPSICRV